MKQIILPDLLAKISSETTLRIWVPGCATGEEAYSYAILIAEILLENHKSNPVQIFATDIDDRAIEIARAGIYSDSIAANVSKKRLNKYFIKEDKKYRVKKKIREMVVFATQSLIKDPPFSKLHIVSCRNLMIYMDQILQKRIIPLFHYTLNENGILILGTSESIGEFSDLFLTIDNKWKVYMRKETSTQRNNEFQRNLFHNGEVSSNKSLPQNDEKKADIRALAKNLILDEYSPPFVIINQDREIIYFSGDTEKYLSPPVGEASFNIMVMARDSIKFNISSALQKVIKQKKQQTVENLSIEHNKMTTIIDIIIRPIITNEEVVQLYLVIFKDKTSRGRKVEAKKTTSKKKVEDKRVLALEQELQSTREYLQTAVEELETLNEEQRSVNEEMQSTNEELQSTNEELETSKEELQSTNEELITVNSELQNKIDELSHVNNDINNLLANTEIGTIFLDTKLRIMRFTPAMTKIFNLIEGDKNRPMSDITANITYDRLIEDAKQVLDTLERKEMEIQDKSGEWYSVRISPYRTLENVIAGIVITFVNITKIKEAENSKRLAAVVNDSNDAITLIDLQGKILAWNKGATLMYGYSEAEALQMNISELIPEKQKNDALVLIDKIKTGAVIKPLISKRRTKDGEIKKVWLTATKLTDEKGMINSIAITERDISELETADEL